MPKRTLDHRAWLIEELKDPATASNYLNEALGDSPAMFLEALRNVGEAWRMSIVATKAGVRRESLYRTLSKRGNPKLNTLHAVLRVLGLGIKVHPEGTFYSPSTPPKVSITPRYRQKLLNSPRGKTIAEFLHQDVAPSVWGSIASGSGYQHGMASPATTGKGAPFVELGIAASPVGVANVFADVNQGQQQSLLLLGPLEYGKQQIPVSVQS